MFDKSIAIEHKHIGKADGDIVKQFSEAKPHSIRVTVGTQEDNHCDGKFYKDS